VSAYAVLDARFEYLLRFGDNTLVLGQRLAAWTGHAPIVEEDLALTNVALDLIGQARTWLAYAGECEGRGRDADDLAYARDGHEFRNVLLVEQRNGNFADTLARQFLFDAWHVLALERLGGSADSGVAGIARKAHKEATYHLRRSADWVVRLGDGTDVSHARMQAAVDALWPYTGELFAADAVDFEMTSSGAGFEPGTLRGRWSQDVADVFADATLSVPRECWMQQGGKRGTHSEHLTYLLAEMQSLRRSVAGERW